MTTDQHLSMEYIRTILIELMHWMRLFSTTKTTVVYHVLIKSSSKIPILFFLMDNASIAKIGAKTFSKVNQTGASLLKENAIKKDLSPPLFAFQQPFFYI